MEKLKQFLTLMSFVGAFFAGVFMAIKCKKPQGMTNIGAIATETTRMLCRTPTMRDGGLVQYGRRESFKPSKWKAPKGYSLKKLNVGGTLPAELLIDSKSEHKDKVIYQIHGGAFLMKFNDCYRGVAVKLSKLSGGASVFSIDYRIAPENKHPAALEDALAGWEWLLDHGYKPENIILFGDSAGANLSIALTEKLLEQGRPIANSIVCMSPWCDLAGEGEAFSYNIYNDPMFGRKKGALSGSYIDNPEFILSYVGDSDPHDKYLSPVHCDFKDFPPMLIQVGTYEVLESDAITIFEKMKRCGNSVVLTRYPGMFHMFQMIGDIIPEAKKSWAEIGGFLRRQYNDELFQ